MFASAPTMKRPRDEDISADTHGPGKEDNRKPPPVAKAKTTSDEAESTLISCGVAVGDDDRVRRNQHQQDTIGHRKAPPLPTLSSTVASDAYQIATLEFTDNRLEQSIETIENAIATTMSLLPPDDGPDHESLAPLYYLLGTILLSKAGHADFDEEDEVENVEQVTNLLGAQEKLDQSRRIVLRLLHAAETSGSQEYCDTLRENLIRTQNSLIQLADIHDQPAESISMLQSTLELLQKMASPDVEEIADAHFALGHNYNVLDSMLRGTRGEYGYSAASAAAPHSEPSASEPAFGLTEYQSTSVSHFKECATKLEQIIGHICGVDISEFAITEKTEPRDEPKAGLKTTGLEQDGPLSAVSTSSRGSTALHPDIEPIHQIVERVSDATTSIFGFEQNDHDECMYYENWLEVVDGLASSVVEGRYDTSTSSAEDMKPNRTW